jgi:hypothetical protein
MRPRTKLQVEVWKLHKQLSEPVEHEAFVISKHEFFYTTHYKNLVCLECNHMWKPAQVWQEQVVGVKCPSCSKKLKKKVNHNNCYESVISYQVTQVVERFQVFRYFSCWKTMSKNNLPKYHFRSLFEEWVDYDKNKRVVVGRNTTWCGDGFNSSDYEVRYNKQPHYSRSAYDSYSSDINCPDAEFLPRFKKYGLDKYVHHTDYRHLIDKVERSPKVETLLKANQPSLLDFAVNSDSKHSEFWDSIKIALRNKYKIKDAGIWYDYLHLLKYFNKDLRNAKFVCPKNLKVEHNRWMKKRQVILDAQRRERERKEAINRQQRLDDAIVKYNERCQKFFDLEFTKGNISISVLKSIDEFKEEGDELKHCVFTNEYYLKEKSLIFSAKVDGKRTETIQLKLPELKIEQARGLDNQPTVYHDEILDIFKSNLKHIRSKLDPPVRKKSNKLKAVS